MLISRRSVVGGLGLLGAGLVQRGHAQAASTEFHVGYQKAGLLGAAKEQGIFERRLKPLGVEVKWSEFEIGPRLMEALGTDAIDFGWVGDVPAIAAQSAGAKFVYVACMPWSAHGMLVPEGSAIRSLAEIKGKKVAVARNTTGESVLASPMATSCPCFCRPQMPPRRSRAATSISGSSTTPSLL